LRVGIAAFIVKAAFSFLLLFNDLGAISPEANEYGDKNSDQETGQEGPQDIQDHGPSFFQ
jgi:hypothetical protein